MAAVKPSGRGIPLSLIIARYFAYLTALTAVVWTLSLVALAAAINTGVVYPANYGAANIDEAAAMLRSQAAFDADAIPTAYRHLHLDAEGAVLSGDLPANQREAALEACLPLVGSQDGDEVAVTGRNASTYAVFPLPDGTICLLASNFMPEFTSRALRDALPNPQNIALAIACAGSLAAFAGMAVRASRVISRKMAPLIEAARRIERQDLDFALGASNVRQINDVLGAMERMRSSLRESLEARWRAERTQRDQVAALAHDLKTPLTVVRANAEFAAEEARELLEAKPNGARSLPGDVAEALAGIAAASEDAACGSAQLDTHVRLLIEASRGGDETGRKTQTTALAAAEGIAQEAKPLARAAGCMLIVERDDDLLAETVLEADGAALGRAVLNLVANALDRTPEGGRTRVLFAIEIPDGAEEAGGSGEGDGESAAPAAHAPAARFLAIAVEDDGPGFTPEALARGRERFFRGDASRTGAASGAHYGIGLSSADEVARSHGGSIQLENRTDASGKVLGARATLRIPAARADGEAL